MYTIKMDGTPVWNNETPEVGIYEAKISLKDNSTQTLEVSVAAKHNPFPGLKMMQSIIAVYQDDEVNPIFEGRPISRKTDFYGNTSYQFEGALGYLYDSIQSPAVYTGQTIETIFRALIEEHNKQVEPWKQFQVGNVTVVDIYTDSATYSGQGRLADDDPTELPDYIYQQDSNKTGIDQTELTTGYESTFDAINNLLVQNLSGHLMIRYENGVKYLDYLKDYLPSEGQVILFGSNLLDYSSTLDYSSICTGILPLGYSRGTDDFDKDDPDNPEHPSNIYTEQEDPLQTVKNKLTISSVNNGSKILWNDEAVKNYGRIVKMKEWSNVKDAQKLYDKAKKYLLSTQFDNLSLECKIIDLHFVDKSIGPLHHMHMVRVKSEPIGMDRSVPISEMDIDLMNPANDTVTLGATYNSISGKLANTSNNLSSVSSGLKDTQNTIKNNNSTYWTNISKTDQAITLESNEREKSEQGIVTDLQAKIQIQANRITSEVTERQNGEVALGSKIEQTASQIQSTVNDKAKGLQSQITQNAESISAKVSNDEFSSKWEQTAEGFTWQADKINFDGKTINLHGGKIIVTTDNGFVKHIDGKDYKLISESSFKDAKGKVLSVSDFIRKYAYDEAEDAINNNIDPKKGYGSKLRTEVRAIAKEYADANISSGYIKKSAVGVNTYINGCEGSYTTYAKMQARKDELVKMVNDLKQDNSSLQTKYNKYVKGHSHSNDEYDKLSKRNSDHVDMVNKLRKQVEKLGKTPVA